MSSSLKKAATPKFQIFAQKSGFSPFLTKNAKKPINTFITPSGRAKTPKNKREMTILRFLSKKSQKSQVPEKWPKMAHFWTLHIFRGNF